MQQYSFVMQEKALKIARMREKNTRDYYFLFMSQGKIVKYCSGSSNPIQQNMLCGERACHIMYGCMFHVALRMRKNCRNNR